MPKSSETVPTAYASGLSHALLPGRARGGGLAGGDVAGPGEEVRDPDAAGQVALRRHLEAVALGQRELHALVGLGQEPPAREREAAEEYVVPGRVAAVAHPDVDDPRPLGAGEGRLLRVLQVREAADEGLEPRPGVGVAREGREVLARLLVPVQGGEDEAVGRAGRQLEREALRVAEGVHVPPEGVRGEVVRGELQGGEPVVPEARVDVPQVAPGPVR